MKIWTKQTIRIIFKSKYAVFETISQNFLIYHFKNNEQRFNETV